MLTGVLTRARCCVVLAVALLAAGCTSAPPKQEPKQESRQEYGQMTVTYQDATSPAAIQGRALMTNAHVLEDMAHYVNGYLKLPYGIELLGAQCGDANAFWSVTDKRITICYEFADLFLTVFKTDPDKHVAALGPQEFDSVGEFQIAVDVMSHIFQHMRVLHKRSALDRRGCCRILIGDGHLSGFLLGLLLGPGTVAARCQ